MDKVYEVWMGWRENNEDCYFRTTDKNEAIKKARFFDADSTKEEKRKGFFVEIRVYANEYDYDIVEF